MRSLCRGVVKVMRVVLSRQQEVVSRVVSNTNCLYILTLGWLIRCQVPGCSLSCFVQDMYDWQAC